VVRRTRGNRATAFVNGRILSMDGAEHGRGVLVVRDGRIAAVGGAGLERAHGDANVVDLAGRTLTPGFIDAHHHLCLAALHPRWADLHGVADLDTLGARLAQAAAREPDAPWIRGADWDALASGFNPCARDLDALGFDRPVLVACFSYHRGVVSTAGLDALGISSTTPDPPGGTIDRDASGRPTGLLLERAWTAAHCASLAGYDDPERWADLVAARARDLLADGITAVHDAACPIEAEGVYRTLAAAGRLPVSVLVMPHGAILAGPDPARFDGPPTGEGDERLRVGPVKLFADGGIEIAVDAHLADVHVEHGTLFPALETSARQAVERGFDVAIHAMGNAGLRAALDAWRAARPRGVDGARCRIEHVTLAGRDQVTLMRDLGIAGVVQPGFVDLLGPSIANVRFDDATWMPFADLLDAGVMLGASSDAPCHVAAPMLAAPHGATRLTARGVPIGVDQAVPMREWLRLYTAGAADVGRQEGERGRLRPGLRGDLVVLDGDVDGSGPLTVVETWVAGECVFSR
jgi:predicted amidohydrolase YtcJ